MFFNGGDIERAKELSNADGIPRETVGALLAQLFGGDLAAQAAQAAEVEAEEAEGAGTDADDDDKELEERRGKKKGNATAKSGGKGKTAGAAAAAKEAATVAAASAPMARPVRPVGEFVAFPVIELTRAHGLKEEVRACVVSFCLRM